MNMTKEIRAEIRDLKWSEKKIHRDLNNLRRQHDRELRNALRSTTKVAKLIARRLAILTGRFS